MNYEELVDDLRDIGKTMFALGTTHISMDNVSISLAYDKGWGQTANDAAAAIEELRKVNCEIRELYEDAVRKLPNRGEWISVNPMVDSVQCSVCGGQLFSAELETPYCPFCGAKMTEVQDEA